MSICTDHIIFAGYYDIVRLNSEDFRFLNEIRVFEKFSWKVLSWKVRNEIKKNEVGKLRLKLESDWWTWKVLNELGKIIEVEKLVLKLELTNFSDNLPTSFQLSNFSENFQIQTSQLKNFQFHVLYNSTFQQHVFHLSIWVELRKFLDFFIYRWNTEILCF